ncbi:MAG: MASE3 domain-containing protein [Halobacteriota archaeon]
MTVEATREAYLTQALVGGGGILVLSLVLVRNYLLFHSLVELFSILVAFAVFVVAWNARERIENNFLAVLGIGYLFIGGVDLLHTLAYDGMGVFPDAGADLPTQLWIFGRFLEAGTLLVAGVFGVATATDRDRISRWDRPPVWLLVGSYGVVVTLGLISIFVLDVFPTTFVEGDGLTPFKIRSEYAIIVVLAIVLALLFGQRRSFAPHVYRLLGVAILLTMAAEFAFTTYVDVYGLSNAIGHFLKFGSFYLIYLAIVKTGIKAPQAALYRELAEREAEARTFEQAVEHSGHAVVITDRDGTIEYVNQTYEDITGYDASELVGESPKILQSGAHDESFYEALWDRITSGAVWNSEFVNERKDGTEFVVNQTIAPVSDASGHIHRFVGVHLDISERKRQEQTLLHRYESLFNSIQDAIVVTDTDRRITNANPACTDLFGYELDEIEGESVALLYDDEAEYERMGEKLDAHVEDARFTNQTQYRTRTGKVFPAETTVFYLRDSEGEIAGYIGLIRDVSDRENRIHHLAILDRILRHNLRNEMNVVQGHAGIIAEEGGIAVAENAATIVETSERLLATADKQRVITRLLSESQPIVSMDLIAILEDVRTEIKAQYPEATLSYSVPDSCQVRAVPQLSQAVREVIENSIVHADRPTPSIDVRREGALVELRVRDVGPGIPDIERRVLTREADVDPLYHASGLGLWLVNLVVDESDGVLHIEDRDTRGSVVTITVAGD